MDFTKITITLPTNQVRAMRGLVSDGKSRSISSFVKHAVGVALFDAEGWRQSLDDALGQTGGPLTGEERIWADSILDPQELKPTADKPAGKTRAA